MYRWLFLLVLLCSVLFGTLPAAANGVVVLCYHDVTDKITNNWAVTPKNLREHFMYLKEQGYTPISLADYQAAATGERQLPAKPVMLTFDDGYVSFYTQVYPLLKEFNYPATMALITSWLEYAPPGTGIMLNWDQVRTMEQSGLVTLASHTHQSHRYITVNPQGDERGMTEMRRYQHQAYETLLSYQQRLQSDLSYSQQIFERELGHKVETIVWPFGAYTQAGIEVAKAAGFSSGLILNDGGFNQPSLDTLQQIRRGIIYGNPSKTEFAKFLSAGGSARRSIKAAQVDLDEIYDEHSPEQTTLNVTRLVERLRQSGANTVYLQAFSDPDGSGNIESVYFATTAAPVKADLFSHVAIQLQAAGLRVYAWMPTLSAQWLTAERPADVVKATANDKQGWYRRATPFSPEVEQQLRALYSDLAAYSYLDGILFQDDLYLNDFEDFSPAASKAFKEQTGLTLTPTALQDPDLSKLWLSMKTERLTRLTQILAKTVKQYRPDAQIARNIYARVLSEPQSEAWFAQNYQQYLAAYDYVVVMAYPYLEEADPEIDEWLAELAATALTYPQAAEKTVFKLQSFDWRDQQWLSLAELKHQRQVLSRHGARHLAYYPEAGLAIFADDYK